MVEVTQTFLQWLTFVTVYACMFSSKCLTWYVVHPYRCDFAVQFGGKTTTSVFQLLQQACFQMVTLSYNNKSSASQQRLVYARFMWGEYVLNAYHNNIKRGFQEPPSTKQHPHTHTHTKKNYISLWSYCSSLNSLNVTDLFHK